ncbi:hypothetical protein BMT54_06375 [Pasteurellaceae bacterium 15-036681]|nr:hypothetical protein BMT54_06375 [Pasteurellaceae bacterium 15-036681]
MRYSVHINHLRCVEWDIRIEIGGIVDLINQASSWATAVVINGVTYYWVEPSKVAEELAAAKWKTDTVRRHFNALKDKEIIDFLKMDGKYYVRLTEKGATWNQVTPIRDAEKNSRPENDSKQTRKNFRESAEKNSADKYIQDINNNQDHSSPPNAPTGKAFKFSDDDFKTAQWILNVLLKFKPNIKKPNLESWANDVRLMREQDKRTHREICELFKWAHNDNFWRANILSVGKLREQWDQLEIRRDSSAQTSQVPSVEEVRSLYQRSLGFGNPFKDFDFNQPRNKILYYATIGTKNRKPLERDLMAVIAGEIKSAAERVDTLTAPVFN